MNAQTRERLAYWLESTDGYLERAERALNHDGPQDRAGRVSDAVSELVAAVSGLRAAVKMLCDGVAYVGATRTTLVLDAMEVALLRQLVAKAVAQMRATESAYPLDGVVLGALESIAERLGAARDAVAS
ncbi:MAG TPA: hypothetical protein VEA38_04140 [Terriglobales bacterium]|nr:hypothetical protein [Terriglobales bacterium]